VRVKVCAVIPPTLALPHKGGGNQLMVAVGGAR
jgi:hypothetical protein